MQQRQPRLGDILDDYCPRERRLTNHAVVAMIGADVKQTRCTTCDAEHEYKHAKVPRQRRKTETPAALYSQVLAGGPKRVVHDPAQNGQSEHDEPAEDQAHETVQPSATSSHVDALAVEVNETVAALEEADRAADSIVRVDEGPDEDNDDHAREEGPVHRPLIRASLPRLEGQPPPPRQAPEFTIRQPGGRPQRFRGRHQRGGQQFQGNRSGGMGGPMRGGPPHGNSGRPPMSRMTNRHGTGRKRSK